MINNNGRVSLIVPCYNGEKYLNRCINCILEQTYPDIELIIVDDGSKDSSEKVILTRSKELSDKLSCFKFIKQKNLGVGGAVNTALKEVTGEFLTLLDVDDLMMSNSIEKKALWLKENKEYAMVFSNGYYVTENDLFSNSNEFYEPDAEWNEDAFIQILRGKIPNWSYMIRFSIWLEKYPNREIYTSRSGQNMQIIFPVAYHNKSGYIPNHLMRYVIADNSLSHFKNDLDGTQRVRASLGYQDIYEHLIQEICDENEKDKLMRILRETFYRSRMFIALDTSNKKIMKEYYGKLKKMKKNTLDDDILYCKLCNQLIYYGLRGVRKAKTILSHLGEEKHEG